MDVGVRRTYILHDDLYTIGRKFDNTIRLSDQFVSKYHATISRVKDVKAPLGYVYRLKDGGQYSAGSKNGTEVNGSQVYSHILKPGDSIRFGPNCSAVYTEVCLARDRNGSSASTDIVEQYRQTVIPTRSSFATIAKEVNQTQERYDLVFRGMNDGIWDWNLISNEIYYSPRWKSILGYKEDEISNTLDEWFDRVHHDDIERLKTQLVLHLSGKLPAFESEHRVLCADREYRWVLCRGTSMKNSQNSSYRIAGSITDINKTKTANFQLLKAVFHDELTGLPNRKKLNRQLEKLLSKSVDNQNAKFGLLFLDLDRFKQINDSLGHNVGDRLLEIVAKRLQLAVRLSDTVFRLGGDEFIVLLQDTQHIEELLHVVERIAETIDRPIQISGHEIFTSASIGVVFCQGQYSDSDSILRDADIAMYEAKAKPELQYAIFDSNMHSKVSSRMKLETELRRGVTQEEFTLFYQPIFSPSHNRFVGAESLVRWNAPNGHLRGPGQFIDVAEETGLIIPISDYVLSQSCRQIQEWKRAGLIDDDFYLNVNISPKYISQPYFDEKVLGIYSNYQINPSTIRLEITENVFLKDREMASNKLQQLRDFGIKIYIDDFGTGYSSLSYLQNLPVDALKVDKSFVSKLVSDPINAQIIEVVLKLAQAMKISVVAEGVETTEQFAHLRKLGIDLMQGYMFSKPCPADEFIVELAKGDQDFNSCLHYGV